MPAAARCTSTMSPQSRCLRRNDNSKPAEHPIFGLLFAQGFVQGYDYDSQDHVLHVLFKCGRVGLGLGENRDGDIMHWFLLCRTDEL